jgi:hypothetical protein
MGFLFALQKATLQRGAAAGIQRAPAAAAVTDGATATIK